MTATRSGPLIVVLLLAAFVAALGGVSAYRKIESFQPLGFSAERAGGGWQVTAVEDSGTGLEQGDRILLVDGREAERLGPALRGHPSGELAVLRDGRIAEITYTRPPLDIDYPYLVLALLGVVYLLIGLYTLFRDRRSPALLFSLWSLASATVYLFTTTLPFDTIGKAVYLGDGLARILLPPLTLHLFLIFPRPLVAANHWARRLVPFVYLPAAVLAALEIDLILFRGTWVFGRPTRAAVALLDRLDLSHLALFALAAVAVLFLRLARHRDWEQYRQVQWIAFGMAGGYVPFILLYLLPRQLGLPTPETLTVLAVLPLALVPLGFAYAILRHKLWDIEVLLRDTISYTLTLLLGIIGFSLVHLSVTRGLPQDLSLARNLLSFVGGLVIAGLLVPAKRGIESTLARFQYGGTFDRRRAVRDFAQELLRERNLERLANRLLEEIRESVGVERANLYVMQSAVLVPVRPEPGLPDTLDPSELPEEVWKSSSSGLSGVSLPTGMPLADQRLFAAGYRYTFPITVLGNRVGLLLAGYREGQRPLNSEDLDVIWQLLGQAALAIENAQLLDRLQHQLEEVLQLQRYSAGIIESSPAGIAVLDTGGKVVSANAAFGALAGTDRSQAVGHSIDDLLPVKPLPTPKDGLLEVSFCDPSGRERHLQLSAAAFDGGPGAAPLRILVVHDVSERVAMENALREKDRLAALGMLAAGVAHEVNTPITGISSYAQMLLAETPPDDPHYEILKKVERQTFRAARILNNLLEFARDRDVETGPVDLVSVIEETLDLLRERLNKRRVRLVWHPPEERAVVEGSDGELQQVMTNLLLNGCDAMSEAGGTLTLQLESDDERIRLSVEDTGVGIPPDRLEQIFEPFFSTKLTSGGTGLGLSISHDIVQRHGGDLRAESRPGEGSRFIMELPRASSPS